MIKLYSLAILFIATSSCSSFQSVRSFSRQNSTRQHLEYSDKFIQEILNSRPSKFRNQSLTLLAKHRYSRLCHLSGIINESLIQSGILQSKIPCQDIESIESQYLPKNFEFALIFSTDYINRLGINLLNILNITIVGCYLIPSYYKETEVIATFELMHIPTRRIVASISDTAEEYKTRPACWNDFPGPHSIAQYNATKKVSNKFSRLMLLNRNAENH